MKSILYFIVLIFICYNILPSCNSNLKHQVIMGPNPYKERTAKITSLQKFSPGLNMHMYCKRCCKTSIHQWGTDGKKFDKDTGFSVHDIFTASECQYCNISVYDSDDDNGDEQVSVEGISFYKCWFEFHGKVHKNSIKNGDWKEASKVQTGLIMVKNNDCISYYRDDFIHWSSAKFRCGYYNG